MLKYSFWGVVLAADQLLLPMFHIAGMPIKPSYVLLGLWLLGQFVNNIHDASSRARRRDFMRMGFAVSGIVASALFGDLVLRANVHVVFSYQTIRNLLYYSLMVLSFGLGQSAYRLDLRWVTRILLISFALNFAITILGRYIPWVVDFYYGASAYQSEAWQSWGITSREDLFSRGRPLGLFGSPTVSMLQVDIIFLFVVIALRRQLLPRPSAVTAFAIMVLPVSLTIVYGARSEFPVSLILTAMFAHAYWGKLVRRGASRKLVVAFAVVLALSTLLVLPKFAGGDSDLAYNVTRMVNLLEGEDQRNFSDAESKLAILRPLLTFDRAYTRWLYSPVFGTGFNEAPVYPFDVSVEYFHNDWLFVLVTSGLVGFGIWLWIVRTYCISVSWLAVLPFFLPGLTNSFILTIPSVMFYFFMIGLLRERLRAQVSTTANPIGTRATIGAT